MDIDDLHPADDYSHRFFIWHEWIQANGPLTLENVFDYFATSMFYDKQSNNQVLRMQTMHTGQPIINEAEELKRFTGIEFALVHAQPPSLFIIHKRERLSPEEVRPLAAYFIMNSRIYQSPDLYSILSNRLLTSLHALQSSLDILRTHRPDFTPRTGFVWPIVDSPTAESLAKKRVTDGSSGNNDELADLSESAQQSNGTTSSTNNNRAADIKKHQNILPLLNAMRTTGIHSAASLIAQTSEGTIAEQTQDSQSTGTPVPTQEATPVTVKTVSQEAPSTNAKASLASGKKKKKRMSSAATAANG